MRRTAMDEGPSLDLVRLRYAYAAESTRPTMIVRLISQRIDARGDDGIWLSRVPRSELLARAAELEALSPAARGALPLWGIPFAIKDNIDLAGLPTTAACPAFAYQPARSATVVERLIAAGAIPIGKTNLDQFATGLVGTRTVGPIPVNPFDPRYVSGGSSSGSALAVAHGLSSFALGTDTAGSGRVPAGFCNIVGLKPTRGRLSTSGLVPACRSIDCISLFALTVADAGEVLGITQGLNLDDPYSRAVPPDIGREIGGRFRFGIPRPTQRLFDGDALAEAGFDAALARLVSLGGVAVEIDFAPFSETASLLYGPFVAERAAGLEAFLREHADAIHPVTRDLLTSGANTTGTAVYQALHRLEALRAEVARIWQDIDLVVVPTAPRPVTLAELEADPIGPNSMLGTYTNFANLLDLAGIAVPAGFRPDGLPHGITLLGPAFAEERLATVAERFHRLVDPVLGATASRLPE